MWSRFLYISIFLFPIKFLPSFRNSSKKINASSFVMACTFIYNIKSSYLIIQVKEVQLRLYKYSLHFLRIVLKVTKFLKFAYLKWTRIIAISIMECSGLGSKLDDQEFLEYISIVNVLIFICMRLIFSICWIMIAVNKVTLVMYAGLVHMWMAIFIYWIYWGIHDCKSEVSCFFYKPNIPTPDWILFPALCDTGVFISGILNPIMNSVVFILVSIDYWIS